MNTCVWYLQGRLTDSSPWIVPVHKNVFTIGRELDRDLILSTAGVSRRHACLFVRQEDLFIEDNGSRNGTYLNGSRINGRILVHNGDILQIGGYEFTIHCGNPSEVPEKTLIVSGNERGGSFAARYGLSEREEEVLYLLIRGKKLPDIGEKLFISPGTAKLHALNIYKKTGCHSRMELITLYRGPVK